MAVGYNYELYVDGTRVFYSNSSFNIHCGMDQFVDMSGEATGSYTYDEGQYAGWTTIQGSTTPEYAYQGHSPVSNVIQVRGKVYLYSIAAPSTVNIVLGNNTLNGVDTIKLTNANDTTSTVDFVYGTTPSGTINVKIGDNTLTGVNELSVLGVDNLYKSFGYATQASGYTVQIATSISSNYEANNAKYSLDNGATWVTLYDAEAPSPAFKTITLNNVTQIKFMCDDPNSANWGIIESTQLNLNLDGDGGPNYSQNYVLTQDVTDIRAYTYYD